MVERKGKIVQSNRLMRLSTSQRREIDNDENIFVVDLSQKPMRCLELYPNENRATLTTMKSRGPAKDPDIIKMAIIAQNTFADDFKEDEIDGRAVRVYHDPKPFNDFTFWMDAETRMPIRIELIHTNKGQKLIWSDFEFDVELDEELFSTEAPEGYDVKQVEK